jgi:hypothetical protein
VTIKRSTAVLIALALLVLLGLGHLTVPFLPDADKIPAIVRYGDVALGVASLLAGYGLWKLFPWGKVATVIIAALNIVSAAPGAFFGPNQGLRITAVLYVALSLLIIALALTGVQRRSAAARV